jgi:restriction system protein
MARRKHRQSDGQEMFDMTADIASYIPWWITIPVAGLLFFFVPDVYSAPENFSDPSAMAAAMVAMLFKGLLKYVLPMALVLGAGMNIFKLFKSESLFKTIKKVGVRETIAKLSWQDFEFLLSEWFKKEGFSTELTGGGGADGGVDIKLYKDGELYLVQCKHYKAWKVSVKVVRELYGVMAAENAVGGYVITSGKFTRDAIAFAESTNITLVDGDKLEETMDLPKTTETKETVLGSKPCPRCGSELVERKSKRGKFIGCSSYPKCRYTQDL